MREIRQVPKGISNFTNTILGEGGNNTMNTIPSEGIDNTACTILGEGVVFEGATLKGKGPIHVLGNFSGTINIDGHVFLGETGVLKGEVHAASALFGGRYEGNLHVRNVLQITSTANLVGKIVSGKIIIDEGAVIKGDCNIGGTERQESAKDVKVLQQQAAQHAK